MSFIIQDRIEVALYINNVEFPLDSLNVLHYAHISWTTRGLLPTIHLSVFDAQHTLDTIQLQDGIPLRITVRAYGGQTQTFNFRKYDHSKVNSGNGFTYVLDGYLDFPKYWLGTSSAGLRGSSNDVLSQIAATCGLQYDGTSTADAQLWTQRNRTYAEFARQIVDHAYVSDTSYTAMVVNPDGTMRVRDVNNLTGTPTKLYLGQLLTDGITVMDYKPQARSGLNNKMTGYQNTRYSQSIVGGPLSQANNQLTFTPDSSSPLYNTTVQTTIARGYQTFGGLDVGNTHANYERAHYQNLRYANLYSLDVEFLVMMPTTLNPLDQVTFVVDQETNLVDRAYSGTYVVAGRAIYITGGTYAEKILGTRTGTDAAYTSG